MAIAVGAAVVTVIAGAVVAVMVSGGEEPSGKPVSPTRVAAPPAWSLKAGEWLTSGKGMRYDGTMTVGGRPVQAHLRVTPAGSATGTLTAGALRADVVAVDGVTYVKASPVFWRDYIGETRQPDYYAGRWAKAPASLPGFDIPGVLGPKAIAQALTRASKKTPTENVNGVPAYRVDTAGADYLLSKAAPHRLLSVRPAGRTSPRFAAAPVVAPATLFAELRPRVAGLGGAADPGLRFQPGTLTFHNCDRNTNGCTVSVPATLSSPSGKVPAGARAALRAAITSRGRPLGSCRTSEQVPSGRALTLRCTVTSGLWRGWVRRALDNPGSYPYEATAHVIGEAVGAQDVPKLLSLVDRERRAVLRPKPNTPGPSGSSRPDAARSATPSGP
ncbi:hypothetical protein BZB76_6694 [Actinomadura pelletieri DSM 43383]|uniref:Uncharacterized protein n=1 Tax=Actinomadura pelletieri DSM 43383 TaxID=1120940 RepID=A0A495QAA9_9ACTN|nr:hypothetical protein [Actinomadura pelletieri]RKS68429.1 hypothetical protein BZB76_6694 [Actinomadura pelletieri DSM 43383]